MNNNIVLKYQKKGSGRMIRDREMILEINGIRHNDFLQHDIRVECLKRALKRLNGEITEAANKFKTYKFGAYVWLYTSTNIRGEELEGLYRLFYLIEIVKYLHRLDSAGKLICEVPLDKGIKKLLQDEEIKIHPKNILVVKNQMLTFIKSSLVFLRIMYFNLKCMFLKPNDFFKGAMINVGATFSNHRYDDIERISRMF